MPPDHASKKAIHEESGYLLSVELEWVPSYRFSLPRIATFFREFSK